MVGSQRGEGSTVIISTVSPGSRFRNCYRVLMFFFLTGYLVLITASHYEPLNPGLEPLLSFGMAPFVLVEMFRLRSLARRRSERSYLDPKLILRHSLNLVILLFIVLAGAAFVEDSIGDLSPMCSAGAPETCFRIDSWQINDGAYYRKYPFDAQGNSDPNQPWVEISRSEYIDEVGTKLRAAAGFGVGLLCFAMLLSIVESATESEIAEAKSFRRSLHGTR